MTLLETIKAMEVIASKQPSIKMVVENDIFRLNAKADARYGVFAFVQGSHTASIDSNVITYAFTLFYVDRLKNDRSNQIEIQSVGIQTLDNIIRAMDGIGIYTETSYIHLRTHSRFSIRDSPMNVQVFSAMSTCLSLLHLCVRRTLVI